MPFTIGLGRNSPIPLEGDPKKYEGLIVRHGQWVRWMSSRKCSCVLENNRPNPKCTYCRGVGWRYSFQRDEEDLAIECQIVDHNTVELPVETTQERVALIQDGTGVIYALAGVFGRFLRISGSFADQRGMVYVSILKDRSKTISGYYGTYLGHDIVQIGILEYQNPWAKIPMDLIEVTAVRRSDGTELIPKEFSVDKILVQSMIEEPAVGESLYVSVRYMPPYRIAILNQAMNEMEQKAIQELGGDSLALFPFAYKVSEQDTITSWASSQVRKKVLKKSIGETDVLPDLFVSKIIRVETLEREYVEGVDFILWDRNTLRWISDESVWPSAGKFFSIEYVANATYRVMQQLPNIRASEDKRFPMRVALKLETGMTGSDQV